MPCSVMMPLPCTCSQSHRTFMQKIDSQMAFEEFILALHSYGGVGSGKYVENFVCKEVAPTLRSTELSPGVRLSDSSEHVVGALKATMQLVSDHAPRATKTKYLRRCTFHLLRGVDSLSVLYAILSWPRILQCMHTEEFTNMIIKICKLQLSASGFCSKEDIVKRHTILHAVAAHLKELRVMRNTVMPSFPGQMVTCLNLMSKCGFRKDELHSIATDVQNLYAKALLSWRTLKTGADEAYTQVRWVHSNLLM